MNLNFKNITLDAKSIIESYTKPWQFENSDLSFANLFIWGTDGKMQYAENEDVLYIKLDFADVPTFLWAPIPRYGTQFDYPKLVYTAFDYLKSIKEEPSLRSVWLPFKELIEKNCPELFINETPMAEDYVYLSESLITLKGKKLHGKRNHINKFIHTNPDFKYKPLDSSMYEECMNIYYEWYETKDEVSIDLFDEKKSVQLALKNMESLNLTGGCIVLNGKIEAFTLGEKITPNMQLVHIEKANPSINGLYPVINQQYALHQCSDVTFINREEDMGLEGMRHAKRSYNPVRMIDKYIVTAKRLEDIPNVWGKDESPL